jgi:K(+)-stimulated pyrophosphate-energized sodium pump
MGNLQWGDIVLYSIPALGLLGILFMAIKSAWVTKQDAGDENMQELAGYIAKGAMAFLKAEWKVLAYFVVIAGALLAWSGTTVENSSPLIAVSFLIGAVLSALAGYIGMNIATKANVRTTQAARTSLAQALKVSFTGGSVMGLGVAGLAVLGLGSLFIVFYTLYVKATGAGVNGIEMEKALEVLAGFSLGAESIALFARVGGGIYTKAADVGADLVGKVEAGIPEDDVRNPATIADNVGDNVGDVAGMGADLFGSYVATILATMVLGRELVSKDNFGGIAPILLPMLIAGLGIIFSIIGMLFVRVKDEMGNVQNALNLGNWSSIILTAVASFFIVNWMLPETMSWTDSARGVEVTRMGVFWAIMVGLVVGALMSIITEYYTAMGKRPVLSIIKQSATGHATNIIGGLSVGMESTVLPILVLAAGIYGSYEFAGLYGVAIAAAGMMATTAMQLAIDAFGPIADNAGGIAEMSQLPEEVRHRTDNLDAVGNTTAATGKGFAIASAALTSLALFAAFVGIAGIDAIDIYKAPVLAGLFVGGMIPFIFSSLAIAAVGRAAMDMVNEVRRQFREIPGIMEYKAKPEYEKCVAISTEASIREMIAPGAIALITPVVVGFIFGPEVLGGLLAGVTVSGVLMGMFQSNAGGAWDNAKKSFEKGVEINGEMFYKKSEPHKASVTGDTVGDPFKDTSGPSMNILIKLMSIVALVIAPHISEKGHGGTAATVALTSTNDSLSFALGLAIGENMQRMEIDSLINYNIFEKAANGAAGMEMEEAQMFLDNYFQRREKAKLASVKTKETSVLDSIKNNTPGVQVAESGLMYVVTQEGTGAYATAQDSVQVEYVGKLMNGQTFDASDAGKPVTFNLGGLIPGFTEGLQKVKEGGKIRLFIPSALAYRDMDQGPIPPYSTLMFDITLVKVYSKK